MSFPTHIPQTPTRKTAPLEYPLDAIPSGLESALDQEGKTLKPVIATTKATDSGCLDPDAFRRLSLSTVSGLSDDGQLGHSGSRVAHARYESHSSAPPATWRVAFQQFWQRNRGLWLVTISQFFGALMNVTTRLLELDEHGMHPFQVLVVRMGITVVLCFAYMWYTKVPYFPLGKKEVRKLLVVRGLSGFFGIFGMYYSLLYLPLADATVITFLAPALAGYACYLLFGEPFTRIEQIASMISLLGVILIARPTSFFKLGDPSSDPHSASGSTNNTTSTAHNGYDFPTPTSVQRLTAIAVSLLGVAGAACVFTTLRWIGKRAHPLISVNYFASWCTLVSCIVLSVGSHLPPPFGSPQTHFALPASPRHWGMLLFLGTCGFTMQFMMTAGLSHEKSNRATNMVYTNMLFALLFDRWIFGTVPGVWSLLGSGLILGSAIYVALQKAVVGNGRRAGREAEVGVLGDEETAMLGDVDSDNGEGEDGDDDGDGQSMPLMELDVRDHDDETEQQSVVIEDDTRRI